MTRKRGRARKGAQQIEVCCGSDAIGIIAAGLTQVRLVPATFNRASAIGDNFAFFRFTKVEFIIVPDIYNSATDAVSSLAIGYIGGVAPDTPPASVDDVLNLPNSRMHGYGKTVDTVFTVGKKLLVGETPLKWYKTVAGTLDSSFEDQGGLFLYLVKRGAGTLGNWVCHVKYTVEFTGFLASGNTPMRKAIMPFIPDDKKKEIVSIGDKRFLPLDDALVRALGLD